MPTVPQRRLVELPLGILAHQAVEADVGEQVGLDFPEHRQVAQGWRRLLSAPVVGREKNVLSVAGGSYHSV